MRRDVRRVLLTALICAGLSACQSRTTPTQAPPNKTAPAIAESPEDAPPPKKVKPPPEPDSPPVAAVRSLLRDVEHGHLEALAEFLPASYGKDLESLSRTLVEKLPDDVWLRLHSIVSKAVTVLKKQPEFAGEAAAENDADRQKLLAALDSLSQEETWDRSRWKNWDFRTLLKGPASTLLAAWQQGASTNATLLSETNVHLASLDGDHAVLELRSALDAEPQTAEFVQVEGKWIPKSLSDGWPATIGKAVTRLADLSEEDVAEAAGPIGPLLLQIEATLNQMIRAERPEEVQLGWWQIESLIVQARQELLEPGPAPRVEIRLASEVSEDELTDLLEQLRQATDHPDLTEYVTFPTTAGMVIQLSPVGNLDEFLNRLTFVTVKSHDAEKRAVEIERKPQK